MNICISFRKVIYIVISSFVIVNYETIVNLIVWSFTLKLVLRACYEYHLTWAWVPHIVREMSGNFRVSGEWSPWVLYWLLRRDVPPVTWIQWMSLNCILSYCPCGRDAHCFCTRIVFIRVFFSLGPITQTAEILQDHLSDNRSNFKVTVTGPEFCIFYNCKIGQKACVHDSSWTAALILMIFYINMYLDDRMNPI